MGRHREGIIVAAEYKSMEETSRGEGKSVGVNPAPPLPDFLLHPTVVETWPYSKVYTQ
jgi:hypothetical protein